MGGVGLCQAQPSNNPTPRRILSHHRVGQGDIESTPGLAIEACNIPPFDEHLLVY